MKKKKAGIGRLLEISGERKGLLILSCGIAVISSAFMLVPYVSVYFVLAELLENAVDYTLVDGVLMQRWGFVALASLILGLLCLYVSGVASHIAAYHILYGLRMRLAEHISGLHLGYFTRTSTGTIKKILEQNVEKIEKFVAHQIPDMLSAIATIVIMFSVMFYLEPWMALACLVSISIGFFIQMSMMFGEEGNHKMKAYHDSLEKINASSIQYVKGISVVKIFGQTVRSVSKFYEDINNYRDMVTSWTGEFKNGHRIFKIILVSLLTFVLPVGVLLLSQDPHNVALVLTVLFFIVMSPGVSSPLHKLIYMSSSFRDISEGVQRIDAIFSEPLIKEPTQAKHPKTFNVSFEDVTFSYEEQKASSRVKAISHVSFHAKEGTLTALVGPSGSGKSTVASLIPRFWDVDKGRISIGGCDIRDMATRDLMDTVAFVFQDNFLFYDTLYNNICVGRPDASREDVIAAAKASQCHDFIEQLPNGYDTLIGEGGVYLSGGEEQRVSVARAILKNAPVLVLDEATAFADPDNEHQMQLALKGLIKSKTVIIIAHRLSTIRHADNIIVLDEGHVAETGRHEDLLSVNGVYRRLWDAYTNSSAWGLGVEDVR